jgi:vacuolar-type H+-ATPase subunit I/STV1
VYPFGADPVWKISANELLFFNSMKMKMYVTGTFVFFLVSTCVSFEELLLVPLGSEAASARSVAPFPASLPIQRPHSPNNTPLLPILLRSVILGISQMIFGVCLKGINALYFRSYLDFFCEFLPMIIFAVGFFGYMVILIFIKVSNGLFFVSSFLSICLFFVFLFLRVCFISERERKYHCQLVSQIQGNNHDFSRSFLVEH